MKRKIIIPCPVYGKRRKILHNVFEKIPNELIVHILSFIPFPYFLRLCLVSKKFYEIITTPSYIWSQHIRYKYNEKMECKLSSICKYAGRYLKSLEIVFHFLLHYPGLDFRATQVERRNFCIEHNIRYLNLDGSIIIIGKEVDLSSLAEFCPNIEYFGLQRCYVIDKSFEKFVERCEKLHSIHLDFSFVESFFKHVGHFCKNLKSIHVNCFSYSSPKEQLELVGRNNGQHLEKLELKLFHSLLEDEAESLLKYCNKLTKLHLSQTKIGDWSAEHISKCGNLTDLNISATAITDIGLEKIAKGCPKLVKLDISFCDVYNTGLIAVANHCRQIKKLEFNYLRRIFNGNAVAKEALLHLCKKLTNLEYLWFSQCSVDDDVGKAIYENLKNLKTLTINEFNLSVNVMKYISKLDKLRDLSIISATPYEGLLQLKNHKLQTLQISSIYTEEEIINLARILPNLRSLTIRRDEERLNHEKIKLSIREINPKMYVYFSKI